MFLVCDKIVRLHRLHFPDPYDTGKQHLPTNHRGGVLQSCNTGNRFIKLRVQSYNGAYWSVGFFFSKLEFYSILEHEHHHFTSQVCGRGNVFVLSVCVSVSVCVFALQLQVTQ